MKRTPLRRTMATAMAAALLMLSGLASPAGAAEFDHCAVRVLAGHTYIFVSLDNPSPAGDQLLWSTCSEMVQAGYAVSISTRTPMSSAGNDLVCSSDVGAAHMHMWAAPDSFSISMASRMCSELAPETVTWWPLG
jgi:hypothetical protein